uniref:Uncharacterized protein n=1 Tax=Meloidogyne enterolobii TaxID=390850 RepID=A0A6V7WM42_MELEN|nr:unnamed protein product [Meloidogyne enterolobii]
MWSELLNKYSSFFVVFVAKKNISIFGLSLSLHYYHNKKNNISIYLQIHFPLLDFPFLHFFLFGFCPQHIFALEAFRLKCFPSPPPLLSSPLSNAR